MLPTREITYPIKLTSAQLATLLSLVNARTLLGADEATLFPADEAQRSAQWERGHAELIADGWIVHDPTNNSYPVHDFLMVLIAAMADPEVVVLTAWETGPQQGYGLAHYVALDLVVEMALVGDIYNITGLESLNAMAAGIARAVGYPTEVPDGLSVRFPKQLQGELWQRRDPGLLTEHGAGPVSAQSFATTIQKPAKVGNIKAIRTYQGRPLAIHQLDILVGQNNLGWVGQLLDDEQMVRYDAVDDDGSAAIISAAVTEVRSMPLETLVETQAR